MGERRVGVEWLHVVVHVVLTARAGIGLLLVVIDGRQADPGAVMSSVAALAMMTLYLGRPQRWERAARSLVMSTLDSLLAVVILLSFGTGGWALGYVAATVFLWALIDRPGPWLVALAGPFTVYLVLSLADLLLGQVTEALAAGARMVVLGLAVVAAARTRGLLGTYRDMEVTLRAERLRAAQAEERTRLSVEMHDSVAKSLHGIHLMSSHLATRLEQDGHPAHGQVAVLRESIDQARQEARRLVAERRTLPQDDRSDRLAARVRAWAEEHPELTVQVDISPFAVGPGAGHELVSAVEEALENVARHAAARTVQVVGTETAGWVKLVVRDDGVGMASTAPGHWVDRGHYGIDGVARRMTRVQGRVEILSRPGEGTEVVLELPARLDQTAEPSRTAGEPV